MVGRARQFRTYKNTAFYLNYNSDQDTYTAVSQNASGVVNYLWQLPSDFDSISWGGNDEFL